MEGQGESELAVRDAFREALRRRVGQARFATWFEGGVAIAISRNADGAPEARVLTASAFEQGLIRKQFLADLEAAAAETLGDESRVVFSTKGVAEPAPARAKRPAAPTAPAPAS